MILNLNLCNDIYVNLFVMHIIPQTHLVVKRSNNYFPPIYGINCDIMIYMNEIYYCVMI